MIDDIQLGVKAKQLVDAVETAGVLAKGADRLSSEQLARYFIRAFKDKQLGKDRSAGPGIKGSLGTELQALTERARGAGSIKAARAPSFGARRSQVFKFLSLIHI